MNAFPLRALATAATVVFAAVLYGCVGAGPDRGATPPSSSKNETRAAGGGTAPTPSTSTGRVGGGVGDTAYDFSLEDADGNEVRLSDFKGKVVVLDFWATWCPPCRKEIPGFVALHRDYQTKGVEVIGVSLDDDWSPVTPFADSYGIKYTIVLGDQNVASRYGNVTSIPTTFVIDQNGIIRSKHVGYGEPAVFKSAVEQLL